MNLKQQGDVLILKIENIPNNAKRKEGKTLAQGEVTGHHHTITKGDAELFEHEGTLFLRINSDIAELTHQEHNTVTIPKGDYKINIVREYSHFDEESKSVKD